MSGPFSIYSRNQSYAMPFVHTAKLISFLPSIFNMLSVVREVMGITEAQIYIVILVFITVSYAVSCLFSYFRPHLRQVPGPFLARFTRLYKVYLSIKGDMHIEHQNLHKKYGPVVRTGPNSVSIGDAEMIPEIYLQGHSYQKARFPPPF